MTTIEGHNVKPFWNAHIGNDDDDVIGDLKQYLSLLIRTILIVIYSITLNYINTCRRIASIDTCTEEDNSSARHPPSQKQLIARNEVRMTQ